MIIRVARTIPSLNRVLRWHWSQRIKEKKAWAKEIGAGLSGKVHKATGKMRVEIISHRARLLDQDNLSGGSKSVVDAIKELGLILDDSPDKCDLSFAQLKRKRDCFTEIRIEEVKEVAA